MCFVLAYRIRVCFNKSKSKCSKGLFVPLNICKDEKGMVLAMGGKNFFSKKFKRLAYIYRYKEFFMKKRNYCYILELISASHARTLYRKMRAKFVN